MQTDELITFEELGALLRLKKTAMWTAKRRGDLPPAIRVGRRLLRWRRQTVEAWLADRERAATIDPVFAERSGCMGFGKKKGREYRREPTIGSMYTNSKKP